MVHSFEAVAIWMAQVMATGDGRFWLEVGGIWNMNDHALE